MDWGEFFGLRIVQVGGRASATAAAAMVVVLHLVVVTGNPADNQVVSGKC